MATKLFRALILILAVFAVPTRAAAPTPVERHGALSVNGNRVVDSHGAPVALSGVSFFWSNTGWGQERFYDAQVVDYFVADWHASLVRAAIGGEPRAPRGYLDDPAPNMARLETIIDAAIKNGIYVIVDWHSHHAETRTDDAVAFFTTVAKKYGSRPNILYEIYNEPLNTVTWSGNVKPYAETVIAAIRAIDPANVIIVGSPTWSQDVDVAAADPIADARNITYTLHFYAGTHKAELRRKAKAALDAGASLFVSEWGTVNANGDGGVAGEEVATWFQFLRENCISNANWAVSDKAEGASIFKAGAGKNGPLTGDSLTTSGRFVRELVRNWPQACR